MSKAKKRPVLVTDTHRGVYFGYLKKIENAGKTVHLEGMRNAFYYRVKGEKGVYALAVSGPAPGSKVGPRVNAQVNDVSKIVDCTSAATEQWEAAAWG